MNWWQRFLPVYFLIILFICFGNCASFAFKPESPLSTISAAISYDAAQTAFPQANSHHYVYDTPRNLLPCTTFCFSETTLHKKVSFLDFTSGQGNNLTNEIRKKLGTLVDRAGEKLGDVIRSRGGSGRNVRFVERLAQENIKGGC